MSRKKIMVVDNDVATLDVISIVLEGRYEVIAAPTTSILDQVAEINPDLILLDNLLDGNTGCTVCKSLKSTPETAHIPVYIMSALSASGYLAAEAGADGFIAKPFDDIADLENIFESHFKEN